MAVFFLGEVALGVEQALLGRLDIVPADFQGGAFLAAADRRPSWSFTESTNRSGIRVPVSLAIRLCSRAPAV